MGQAPFYMLEMGNRKGKVTVLTEFSFTWVKIENKQLTVSIISYVKQNRLMWLSVADWLL